MPANTKPRNIRTVDGRCCLSDAIATALAALSLKADTKKVGPCGRRNLKLRQFTAIAYYAVKPSGRPIRGDMVTNIEFDAAKLVTTANNTAAMPYSRNSRHAVQQ